MKMQPQAQKSQAGRLPLQRAIAAIFMLAKAMA